MSSTEPRATRDKERTRSALVEAASRMMAEQGAGVSLADIATAANVSKGALTHHFPTRESLEVAVLTASVRRLRETVYAHVDISENTPGKLLRGYVRALTADLDAVREVYSPSSLLVTLGSSHAAQALLEHDAEQWRDAFAADGIDLPTSLIVRNAAEGLAMALDSPYLTAEELSGARDRLLELAIPAELPEDSPPTSRHLA